MTENGFEIYLICFLSLPKCLFRAFFLWGKAYKRFAEAYWRHMVLPLKRMVLPTDFSEPFYEALETAKELASQFAPKLFLIHVIPALPPFAPAPEDKSPFNVAAYVENPQSSAEKSLEEVIDKKIGNDLKKHIKVAHGDEAEKIVRQAQKERIDLIVISRHGMKSGKKHILGSVTEKLTHISPVPILTVRNPLERKG